jgi:hypothetical protein
MNKSLPLNQQIENVLRHPNARFNSNFTNCFYWDNRRVSLVRNFKGESIAENVIAVESLDELSAAFEVWYLEHNRAGVRELMRNLLLDLKIDSSAPFELEIRRYTEQPE